MFERREAEGGGYGGRKIVLAISSATQDLLNKHLTTETATVAKHGFAPTCSINLIEQVLRASPSTALALP